MSARELRAEARAWRRAAVAADLWLLYGGAPFQKCTKAAQNRLHAHMALDLTAEVHKWDAIVLACLFLALECEDEARALGRGAR